VTATTGSDSSTISGSGSGTITSVAENIIVGGDEVEETDALKRKRRLVRKKKNMVYETNEIDVIDFDAE
jgi:hypothetical protein